MNLEIVRFLRGSVDVDRHQVWISTVRCEKCGKLFEGELV